MVVETSRFHSESLGRGFECYGLSSPTIHTKFRKVIGRGVLNESLCQKKASRGNEMRYLTAFCLFVLLSGHETQAQVLPSSNGGCTISASDLMDCDWASTIELRRTGTKKTAAHAADERPELFVTTFILAPGAPLDSRAMVGSDVLIVGRNNGEVVNEKKSPPVHINVFEDLVMLMPKNEPYLLRNVGKDNLELLLIEVRKETPKSNEASQVR